MTGAAMGVANDDLPQRLWLLIEEMDAAGHVIAASHATMAWSLLTGEQLSVRSDRLCME